MERIVRVRPSPGTVIALVALFVALSGTALSAIRIDSSKVVNNSLKSADLKNNKGVKDADVVPNTLTGKAINEAKLGRVPSATNADTLDDLDSTAFLGANAPAAGDLTGNYPNPSIAAGAVGTAELEGGAVTSEKLAAGLGHTTHFARVKSNGTLVDGTATSATRLSLGSYRLQFPQSIDKCAGAANSASFSGFDSSAFRILAQLSIGFGAGGAVDPDKVGVNLFDDAGASADSSFSLVLVCP